VDTTLYTVSSTATLGGFTTASYSSAAAGAFASTTASVLGVPASAVSIASVTDVGGQRRRRLFSAGVAVAFAITSTGASAASAIHGSLTAISADPTDFASALNGQLVAAGVTVVCTVSVSAPIIASFTVPTLNASDITNVSATSSAITSQLATLSGADLSIAQNSLLISFAGADTSSSNVAILVLTVVSASPNISTAVQTAALSILGGLVSSSATQLTNTASLALLTTMTVLTAGSAPLSAASTTNAASVMAAVASSANVSDPKVSLSVLNVLSSIAGGQINVSGTASNNMVAALSSVVSGALSNPAALTGVSNVLATLADSQAASLLSQPYDASGPAVSVSTSSPTIQTKLAVSPPSALSSLPLTVPGSPSAFAPLSASLLGESSPGRRLLTDSLPVVVAFHSLAFDPFSPAPSIFSTTGSTRLQLSAPDKTPIPVQNAVTPIHFTLPAVSTSVSDKQQAIAGQLIKLTSLLSGSCGVGAPVPTDTTVEVPLMLTGLNSDDVASASVAVRTSTNGSCPGGFNSRMSSAVANQTGIPIPSISVSIIALDASTGSLNASLSVIASSQAVCQYWDTEALAYSTAGCAGVPSPSPANHSLTWLSLTTPADVILPLTWNVSGPLSDGCLSRILDCASTTLTAYPLFDTTSPGGVPAYIGSDARLCVNVSLVDGSPPSPSASAALLAAYASTLGVRTSDVSLSGTLLCVTTPGGLAYSTALAQFPALAAALNAAVPGISTSPPYALALVFPSSTRVFPDPSRPFQVPAVTCPAPAPCSAPVAPVLRVFYGSTCGLLTGVAQGSHYGCAWNATRQSFVGEGCSATEAPDGSLSTQCSCRHLTDFASGSQPQISTCSISDLVGLNPADIVTKLRVLFIVVCVLFGVMHLGIVVGLIQDARERRRLVALLSTASVGWRETPSGAQLWRFSLSEVEESLAPPSGPAVSLSLVMGVPFSRLRIAIPDDHISWSTGAALGRIAALSLAEVHATHDRNKRRKGGASSDLEASRSAVRRAAEAEVEATAASTDEFIGTALVLAFLHAEMLMPLRKLAFLQAAARKHFEDVRTPRGRDWSFVHKTFMVAFDGNLNAGSNWLNSARLIRLVLCQSTDGSWDASTSTAFALLARQHTEMETVPVSLFDRIKAFFADADQLGAGDVLEDMDVGGDDDGEEEGNTPVHTESGGVEDKQTAELEVISRGESNKERSAKKNAEHERIVAALRSQTGRIDITYADVMAMAGTEITDCPLTCSLHALQETLPLSLASLRQSAEASRLWTTMCVICVLERFKISWVEGDGELCPEFECTIVDAAQRWIDYHAANHPDVAHVLEGDDGKKLYKAARKLTLDWNRAWLHRVKTLRRDEAITDNLFVAQAERAGRAMVLAVQTRHETFRIFLAPAGRYRRWQQCCVALTLVIVCLAINIWCVVAAPARSTVCI